MSCWEKNNIEHLQNIFLLSLPEFNKKPEIIPCSHFFLSNENVWFLNMCHIFPYQAFEMILFGASDFVLMIILTKKLPFPITSLYTKEVISGE